MPQHPLVYIGNWSRHKPPGGTGFGVCRFDPETGQLELIKTACPDITVGAACLDRRRGLLYCVDEYTILPGYFQGGGGQVFALKIDPETGDLAVLSHAPSFGTLPSGVAITSEGAYLVATHHTDRVPTTKVVRDAAGRFSIALEWDDAATVLFPLGEDGAVGEPCDLFVHTGDGGPLAKQTHPQLHSVTASPSGELFLVCDKGNDEILMFRIDRSTRRLILCSKAVKTLPGSSPRYSAFHPTHPYVFVNHETQAVVGAYRFDEDGALTHLATVGALPAGQDDDPEMKQSDIVVHPSGEWLYTLLRGISAVTAFRIDRATGSLDLIQTVSLESAGPRGCAISPDGRFMIIACLEGKDVLVWAIGPDGRLLSTGMRLSQPNPGTVTFFQPAQ